MTPLEIHCLLEYHTMPWGSPSIKNRHPMGVSALLEAELIEVDNDSSEGEGDPIHKITAKGTFYVEALENLPLPISTLSIPDQTNQSSSPPKS